MSNTGTELQAALNRYQAATTTTHEATLAWEDAKAAETSARLAMNTAGKEEEQAADALLALIQQPGLVIVDRSTLPHRPTPITAPEPAPAETTP